LEVIFVLVESVRLKVLEKVLAWVIGIVSEWLVDFVRPSDRNEQPQ
jgi:hypothetical protein